MARARDKAGRLIPVTSKDELDQEVQRIYLGFFPNRTIQPEEMPLEERIARAQSLAPKYEKLGLSPPASLLNML